MVMLQLDFTALTQTWSKRFSEFIIIVCPPHPSVVHWIVKTFRLNLSSSSEIIVNYFESN